MAATEVEKKRMQLVVRILKKTYPDSTCSLKFESPYQLAVATILSAQCTDARVNQVTPVLFSRYPDARTMARAPIGEIEKVVRSTGFYKNKAKSVQEMSKELVSKYGGDIPEEMDLLLRLRGIGRKTANVILGTAFKKNVGIVVDTHVGRISRRLGFTTQEDPVKVEKDLMLVVPKGAWTLYSHLLIDHGRAICTARKAYCDKCPIFKYCKRVGVSFAGKSPR